MVQQGIPRVIMSGKYFDWSSWKKPRCFFLLDAMAYHIALILYSQNFNKFCKKLDKSSIFFYFSHNNQSYYPFSPLANIMFNFDNFQSPLFDLQVNKFSPKIQSHHHKTPRSIPTKFSNNTKDTIAIVEERLRGWQRVLYLKHHWKLASKRRRKRTRKVIKQQIKTLNCIMLQLRWSEWKKNGKARRKKKFNEDTTFWRERVNFIVAPLQSLSLVFAAQFQQGSGTASAIQCSFGNNSSN